MKSCVFFGHRAYPYEKERELIENSIVDLVENYGVGQFYSGGRGDFDNLCAQLVYELKKKYPHIKNTLFLSYMPQGAEGCCLPKRYDDTVYLLEKRTPPRYAIVKTNEAVVKLADFVLSGVYYSRGGAYQACEYARRRKKTIIQL